MASASMLQGTNLVAMPNPFWKASQARSGEPVTAWELRTPDFGLREAHLFRQRIDVDCWNQQPLLTACSIRRSGNPLPAPDG
jgi:hypothetical protein